MKSKIVAVVISFMLISQQMLFASDLSSILLKNDTYAGTWDDPSSGMKYMTGGGIKIKFKQGSTNFTPWVKGSMPSYSIGCNGISISGGFVGLLGLNDIENQLKDAGAAFAWGILTGLAYSLPVIGDVFAKIQKWARTIQRLLQNACSISQNLAKNSKAKKEINSALENNLIKQGFDKVKTFMDSADEQLTELEKFVDCQGEPACLKRRDSTIGKMLTDALGITSGKGVNNAPGGTTASSLMKLKNVGTNTTYKEIPLHQILNTSNSHIQLTEEDILNIKLSLLFFGDIALGKDPRAEIADLFKADGTLDEASVKATGKEILANAKSLAKKKFELVSPKLTDIKNVVDILINGSNSTLYVPNYKVGILSVAPKSGTATKNTTAVYLIKERDDANKNHANLALNWAGFYKEGVKQIYASLNQTSQGTSDPLLTIPVSTTSSGTITKDYVPVLIPQFARYVKELRQIVKSDSSKSFSVNKIALKLAQVNAALATNALVEEITARVKNVALNATDQANVFAQFLSELNKKNEKLLKEVEAVYVKDKDIAQLLDDEVEGMINKTKNNALK